MPVRRKPAGRSGTPNTYRTFEKFKSGQEEREKLRAEREMLRAELQEKFEAEQEKFKAERDKVRACSASWIRRGSSRGSLLMLLLRSV